jgi:hypothetical protein
LAFFRVLSVRLREGTVVPDLSTPAECSKTIETHSLTGVPRAELSVALEGLYAQ